MVDLVADTASLLPVNAPQSVTISDSKLPSGESARLLAQPFGRFSVMAALGICCSLVAVACTSLLIPAAPAGMQTSSIGQIEAKAEVNWAYLRPTAKREWCLKIENNVDYIMETITILENTKSASMCCAACTAFPSCQGWTWGKNTSNHHSRGKCWIKKRHSEEIEKNNNTNVMSGVPHPWIKKAGVTKPPASKVGVLQGVRVKDVGHINKVGPTCPGKVVVTGLGAVTVVNAAKSHTNVLGGDAVFSRMYARSYMAEYCAEGRYDNKQYVGINLLGKTFHWTIDLSGTACGCNAVLQLADMRHNSHAGSCHGDHYCDVVGTCGVQCWTIDLMQANMYAFKSTLHAKGDVLGASLGYGGSQAAPVVRDWTSKEYGPGGKCVDTTQPFNVAISFPAQADKLQAFEIELSQNSKPCTLSARQTAYVWGWPPPEKDSWDDLRDALKRGLTPVMAYWKSDNLLWLDGLGEDGRGPCARDQPEYCRDRIRFSNFSISSYVAPIHPPHLSRGSHDMTMPPPHLVSAVSPDNVSEEMHYPQAGVDDQSVVDADFSGAKANTGFFRAD